MWAWAASCGVATRAGEQPRLCTVASARPGVARGARQAACAAAMTMAAGNDTCDRRKVFFSTFAAIGSRETTQSGSAARETFNSVCASMQAVPLDNAMAPLETILDAFDGQPLINRPPTRRVANRKARSS
mmetsp:Transcript_15280/g.41079  ORF Transcript_15280/g.41079 Transcript_15280/m.41079 type:complete len:130 (-) Transcript_15280:203-592(-)